MCYKILFVVVLYNQNYYQTETYRTLLKYIDNKQLYKILVYDNSSTSVNNLIVYQDPFVEYISDKSNPGVSKAYNYAATWARENNFSWILLLDQDTIFPNDILCEYIDAIRNNPQIKLFVPQIKTNGHSGFLSPSRMRSYFPSYSKEILPGLNNLKRLSPVNSGMLINVDSFWMAGGYNTRVKLDFSDHQFIDRFKRIDQSFYVLKAVCIQNYSDDELDKKKKLNRFVFFCRGAMAFEKTSILVYISIFLVILKRAFSLSFHLNSFAPIIILFKTLSEKK